MELVCLQTHTTPLLPWETFPPSLFVLLTSLILCTVQTSQTDLQKVPLIKRQLLLVYLSLTSAEHPDDAADGDGSAL